MNKEDRDVNPPLPRVSDKASWIWFAVPVLVLTAMIAIATRSYREIDRELTDFALARRQATAYLAAATLSEKFERLTDLGISFATRVRFRALVAARRWGEAVAILKDVPDDFPFIDRLALFDRAGNLMADVREPPKSRGKSFAFRDWYKGVSANWRPYVSEIYRRPARPVAQVFAVAVPISGRDNRPLGILQMQVRLDQFFDWIKEVKLGAGEIVYVVDHKGHLAYHPHIPPRNDLTDVSQVPAVHQLLQRKAGLEIGYSPLDKEDVVAAYVPVSKHGWGVVAQRSTRTAFAQRDLLLHLLQVAYALAALFTVVTAWLVMHIGRQRRHAEAERLIKLELEARVAERTAQLENANRELESFSYSIAHDLRTPLRAIDGFSRRVLDEHGSHLPAEAQRLLDIVGRNAKQMGLLIDNLLAFSHLKRQSISKLRVDMTQLARQCWEELAPERGKRELRFEAAELPFGLGDPALLKQVWTNLLANAIKYTGKSARPVVQVGCESAASGEVAYYVRDNGAGFDMKYAGKLFGVFQRLHRAQDYEGTGVGLAIVAHIVQRHGGRVWASAEPDRGATFYFTLGSRNGES